MHGPKDLRPLLALRQLKYLSAEFGSVRMNAELDALLVGHGKTRHAP